jgi:hypothetical protein
MNSRINVVEKRSYSVIKSYLTSGYSRIIVAKILIRPYINDH